MFWTPINCHLHVYGFDTQVKVVYNCVAFGKMENYKLEWRILIFTFLCRYQIIVAEGGHL